MILFLVRHAVAGERDAERWPDDSLRPLTKKGKRQFRRLLNSLGAARFAPERIGTSPYTRAAETAELLLERPRQKVPLETVEAFAPGCRAMDVIEWAKQSNARAVAYVGHSPDIDEIAAELIGAQASSLQFSKGAIARLDFSGEPQSARGTLRWLVAPKLIAKNDE